MKFLNSLFVFLLFIPVISFAQTDGETGVVQEKPEFVEQTIKSDNSSIDKQEPLKLAEEMPRFPGCEEFEEKKERQICSQNKTLEFIYSNIRYPKKAYTKNIAGTVVINFIIEKDGSINEAKILRDIGGGCGKEALRIVKSMPNWVPGIQKGEPVRVSFNLPIRFNVMK